MWPLVEVLPYDPVTATTVGPTRTRRFRASSTKWVDSRCSTGEVTRQARSTRNDTATAAAAANGAAGPTTTPAATTTISRSAQTAAKVRRRRVQARAEVRPRRDNPIGPAATPTATRAPARGHRTEATAAATTAAARATLAGVVRHHRQANRVTDPPR